VLKLVALVPPPGEDLVGGDGDGADLFALAHVRADLIRREVGLVEDLAHPLVYGRGVRGQDEGVGVHEAHRLERDDGLARAAGQHDDARAAARRAVGEHGLGRGVLIVADRRIDGAASACSRACGTTASPPATKPARSSTGQPALTSVFLISPRLAGSTTTIAVDDRDVVEELRRREHLLADLGVRCRGRARPRGARAGCRPERPRTSTTKARTSFGVLHERTEVEEVEHLLGAQARCPQRSRGRAASV
jgi:hypothetical protein